MKKSYGLFLSAVAFSVMFASCASKPKVEEKPIEEPEVIEQPVQEEEKEEEPVVTVDDSESKDDEEADKKARVQADEEFSKALEAKKKIDELNFSSYDQKSYDDGNKDISDYESKKDSASGEELLNLSKDAYAKYTTVLYKAYKKLAKDARLEAFKAKKDADSVKAGVAAKTEYNQAAEEFKAGDSNYAMQNCESAYNHYLTSKVRFEAVYLSVSEKRAEAQKAMEEAKAKVLESENYALDADQEKPLDDANVEGIEAEDAVLLEEDNYEAPETQEANIPEEIEDFEGEENHESEGIVVEVETPVAGEVLEVEEPITEKESVIEEATTDEVIDEQPSEDVPAREEDSAPEEEVLTEEESDSELTEEVSDVEENPTEEKTTDISVEEETVQEAE